MDKTPDTPEHLQERVAKLEMQADDLTPKVKWYEEQFRLSRQKQFGSSRERTQPDQLQLDLFNEAELETDPKREEPTVETVTYQRRKARGQREAMLRDLPVETVGYHLPRKNGSAHAATAPCIP